ncbi:hypothetical protein [Streptomyces sp. NPDC001985]|uniref:hypothetical protein n=1 Tax=Streptomyces sp. NPDC001985 TaxID=3154406 RepID=UPI00332F1DCD
METDPIAQLKIAQARYDRMKEEAEAALRDVHAAVVAAHSAGVKQVEVVAITGYSRERIRQITRQAGIQPS